MNSYRLIHRTGIGRAAGRAGVFYYATAQKMQSAVYPEGAAGKYGDGKSTLMKLMAASRARLRLEEDETAA